MAAQVALWDSEPPDFGEAAPRRHRRMDKHLFPACGATAADPCIHASCMPSCPENRAAPWDGAVTAVSPLWSCPPRLLQPPRHTVDTVPRPTAPTPAPTASMCSPASPGPFYQSNWDSTQQLHHHLDLAMVPSLQLHHRLSCLQPPASRGLASTRTPAAPIPQASTGSPGVSCATPAHG